MSTGRVEVIYGGGIGKTALALGKGLQMLARRKYVIVIQFLKGNQNQEELDAAKRLEPGMKVFRFERAGCCFADLTEEQKKEEQINIRNGLNFARKVLDTGECDLLILDEVLGLVDQRIISEEEILQLLDHRDEADVIMTGATLPGKLAQAADRIDRIEQVRG